MSVPILEICVDSLDSALEAARGGADRLEVCANLLIGGTTPGPALVRAIVQKTGLPVHALIRARAGDFLYTQDECEQMCEEIRSLVAAGARGVVIGSLNPDGTLNEEQMRAMIQAAQGAHVTLHRAFDMCADQLACLETAVSLGVDTILTSGGEDGVDAGEAQLTRLVRAAGKRVSILAGGGVDEKAIRRLFSLGLRAFHLSGKKTVESAMTYRNPRVHMGACGMSEYERLQTDAGRVRAARESLCAAFVRAAMPMQDALDVPEETIASIVRASLRAWDELPFARAVDPDVFYTYVLMPRVNDERIDDARATLYAALLPQVKGMDDVQAALAVNNWCACNVRYAASDNRTRGVQGVWDAGEGRCGEESVFCVNALRAVGIPARQVYALWWSHCDDNHAWVEVYVQGAWHYIGACEPEEALDRGWFTSAASRAMLVHTRAFGDASLDPDRFYFVDGGDHSTRYAGVNRTHAYAKTCRLQVCVEEGAGARVRFLLANSGRLRTLYERETDAQGCVTLETGLGGLYVLVCWPDGVKTGRAVDTQAEKRVLFSKGMPLQRQFYLRAPKQTRLGQEAPQALCARCAQAYGARRAKLETAACALAQDDAELAAVYRTARGHAQALDAFLRAGKERDARRAMLLGLDEKDRTDVGIQALEDALAAGVSQLRTAYEQLYPVYGALRAYFEARADAPQSMEAICAWVNARIREEAPCGLDWPCRADAALLAGRCAAGGRALLARQIAAALGVAWEDSETCVSVTLDYPAELKPQEDFALLRLTGAAAQEIFIPAGAKTIHVPKGDYALFVLARQLDGSVYGHMEERSIDRDCTISLEPECDRTQALLRHEPLPELLTIGGGNAEVVAFLAPGEEPTAHFLLELTQNAACGTARFLLLTRGGEENPLVRAAAGLDNVEVRRMDAAAEQALSALRARMDVGDARLPFVLALSPKGEGLYACGNYAVGSVARLLQVLAADRQA